MNTILFLYILVINAMSRIRSRQDIVEQILDFLQEPKRRTHVMYGVNLSYNQMQYYFREMISSGLIQSTEDNRLVATEKGRAILRLYQQAEMVLEEKVSPSPMSS